MCVCEQIRQQQRERLAVCTGMWRHGIEVCGCVCGCRWGAGLGERGLTRHYQQINDLQDDDDTAVAAQTPTASGGDKPAVGESHLFFGCRRRDHDFLYVALPCVGA